MDFGGALGARMDQKRLRLSWREQRRPLRGDTEGQVSYQAAGKGVAAALCWRVRVAMIGVMAT